MSTTNKAVEGDYIEYTCAIKYTGTWAPVMKWKDGSGTVVQAKDGSSADIVRFGIVVEMTPSHNGQSFTCQTYFDKPQTRVNSADNIPINNDVYRELYTSAQLTVYCTYRLCWHKCHICCILSICKMCFNVFKFCILQFFLEV